MSTRSTDERAASRAEARRRARLAARGELPDDDNTQEEVETPPQRGGFLQRLFPPAPPLPNRPDPLAGFDASGPLRPIRERLFLLRRNLLAWTVPGVIGFFGFFASQFYGTSVLGMIGSLLFFGGLIAAGWIGWQRPTLYGAAAGAISYLVAWMLIYVTFARAGAGPEAFGGLAPFIVNFLSGLAIQAGFGFFGGWYGGYLRRRQTQLSAERRPRRR